MKVYFRNGIGVLVRPIWSDGGVGRSLRILRRGVLDLRGRVPAGFDLILFNSKGARMTVSQKDVGESGGAYESLAKIGVSPKGHDIWGMKNPIEVKRARRNVWTSWHSDRPNRLDCWFVKRDGRVHLFQVGVITHDDGKTFRLLGEYRWKGLLYRDGDEIVVSPDHPKWGAFLETRRSIFSDFGFVELLFGVDLRNWHGDSENLDPPLDTIPDGCARVSWYVPFAGQTGQGIAGLADGTSCWVHGIDVEERPERDGIKRLYRNDLVSYGEVFQWGKKNCPPKLTKVRRVR